MSRRDVSDELVVKAVAMYQERGLPWPYDLLAEWTGQPAKVCFSAMERAYDHDLIECGVSLRTSWLTDKGKALLAATGLG